MVFSTCEALVQHALDLLDAGGMQAEPAACHLQAALDALRAPSAEDVDELAAALWPAGRADPPLIEILSR